MGGRLVFNYFILLISNQLRLYLSEFHFNQNFYAFHLIFDTKTTKIKISFWM